MPASAQGDGFARLVTVREYVRRGVDRMEAGDARGALPFFDRALKLNPKGAEIYVQRGYARAQLRDYKGAIADQSEALRLKPTLAEAFANRGTSRYRLGDRKGAREDWQKAQALFRAQGDAAKANEIAQVIANFR